MTQKDQKNFQILHDKACQENQDFYIDPTTGYVVFTEIYHRRRGSCCQSGCRHCPWNFAKNKDPNPLKKSDR